MDIKTLLETTLEERVYELTLDMKRHNEFDYIEIVRGDRETNLFKVDLIKDEETYNVKNKEVEFTFVKGDKTTVIQSTEDEEFPLLIDESGQYIYCILKPNSISAAGLAVVEVTVKDIDGRVATSQNFSFTVRKNLYEQGIESSSELPVLQKLLKQVEEILIKQENMVGEESERVENELVRKALYENMFSLKSNLEILKENVENTHSIIKNSEETRKSNEIAREKLKSSLEILQGDLNTLQEEIGISIGKANQSASNADNKAGLVNTALEEIDARVLEINGIIEQISTKEQERISSENTRVENERLRVDAENTRDTEFTEKINDFVEETERVESEYPIRLTEVENDLTALKEDYIRSKDLPHFNHVKQEYVNLDKFWDNLRDGKIYTVEFNQFEVSPSPIGVKKDDNEELVMEPSTNTERGRDDYSDIGLFKPIEVNAYVDENDDYHVIAMKGDGRFKRDGTMGDVYIMNMVGYQKRYSSENVWGISYSDTAYGGFEILDEAVKPDGTIRPYLLHAKYVAGRNPHENNNLASISGVPAEYDRMSHNGQITEFKKKGAQYSGKTSHDDYYVQLIMWLKYANMSSDNVMKGCQSYYLRYDNLVEETNVKRVIVTNAQGNALLVGSTVDITGGCTRANITKIEDLGGNSAAHVDADTPFNTTLSTKIETYPWNSGSCDNVLGVDGSPTSFTSGKEPFIINGIEMIVGGYEVLQNLIILSNAADNRTDAYINYDCLTYATSITSDYELAGRISTTNAVWRYGSKISISDEHPSLILTTETEGSSTTGTGAGIYTNNPSDGGTRVWLSLGDLSLGAPAGLRCVRANGSLASSSWYILGRLSATGRSRRRG